MLVVKDHGKNPQESNRRLRIKILDVNDNKPQFPMSVSFHDLFLLLVESVLEYNVKIMKSTFTTKSTFSTNSSV